MFLDLTTTTYRSFTEIPDRWIASVSKDSVQPTDWHKQAFDLNRFQRKRKTSSVQLSSVAQSCPTPRDPMNRSTPGLPVHHRLPEFTQTHVHRVSDAIQPSHPLSSPSPPAFNLSQHRGQMSQVFISGGLSIGVSASASVLPMNIQEWFPLDGKT